MSINKEEIRAYIRKNYANVALNKSKGTGCCGSSGCCSGDSSLVTIDAKEAYKKTWL